MAEDKLPQFAEDDDVARARAFWNENGKSIVAGVIIGLGGIVGFNYWKSYQQLQGENASVLFEQIRAAGEGVNLTVVSSELKENYPASLYSDLAAFAMAKHFVEEEDLESAVAELEWVVNNSTDTGFQHIARLRMASVFLAQDKIEQALDILKTADKGAFQSRYYELTGDAYAQRNENGDSARAKIEYQKSLDTLPGGESTNSRLIKLKLDNVGES